MILAEIRKALVPLVILMILSLLAVLGITEDMTVGDAVSYIVTSAFVWLIPNRPKL